MTAAPDSAGCLHSGTLAVEPRVGVLSLNAGLPPRGSSPRAPRLRSTRGVCADIERSVDASAARPMGPTATDALPPNLNSFLSKSSTASLFMTTSTRSVACRPNWAPKVPPERLTNAGRRRVAPVRVPDAHDALSVFGANHEAPPHERGNDHHGLSPFEGCLTECPRQAQRRASAGPHAPSGRARPPLTNASPRSRWSRPAGSRPLERSATSCIERSPYVPPVPDWCNPHSIVTTQSATRSVRRGPPPARRVARRAGRQQSLRSFDGRDQQDDPSGEARPHRSRISMATCLVLSARTSTDASHCLCCC